MEIRKLGNSGLSVSALGFGAGQIGDPAQSEDEIGRFLNQILDVGITLIDTARAYGLSEERIGRHLHHRRNEFVISTKVGYGIPGYQDWTGPCITAGVDFALNLLQTDHIDIVHFHSCPIETLQQGEIIEALLRAVDAGKVRAAAYSGDNDPFDWALHSGKFHSLQTSLNLCDQRAAEGANLALQKGVGIIAKRPLANAPWRFATRPDGDQASGVYWERWRTMGLEGAFINPSEIALRFSASLPGVCSCIVGTRNIEHLKRNVQALEKGTLPLEEMTRLRNLFHQHDREWSGQI